MLFQPMRGLLIIILLRASLMKGCLVEMNVDYPGDGTGAFDLAIVPKTRSAEACAEMCGASDMCQSWTYIKKPSHAHFQNCVLKKQFKPNREESDCCVSGTPCARKPKLACPEGYHEGGDCTRAGQCCTATKTADCGEVCLRVSCEADNGVYEKPFTCMIRASEQFTLGAPGTTCASEGLVIKDEAECERAVAMLGHTTGWWKGTLSSIPSGCSIDHVNGPHFNRVISGVGTERADLRPICRVPSSTNLPTCYQAVEMDYTHTMGPKRKLAAFRSAEECGQACGATPLCRSWTYVSDKGDSRYRDCYLGESIATTGVKSTCCTSGAACQDLRGHQGPPSSVTLDKLSFLLGEEIKISFTKQSTVKAVGKIAIYAPNDVESAAAPTSSALWLYTCGTQKCTNEISSGSVTFGSSTNAANTQTWPLGPGAYQIVLMSHDSKIEARSKEFVVHPDHKNFNLQGAATSRRRVDLENAGKDCWVPCNKQSGACTFCGSGRCCKKGLGDGGCSELEGGDGFHTCVAGFGWQTPLPGAISCGNARTFHGKNVGLLPCQLLCQRDPFCRSIYGALDSGDRSCWTCPEYTPRKARRLGDGEETDNKKSSLETDYKSIEFKRESRWAFKTFRGAKTCPEGFEDLNEKECTEVAAAVITASGGAQIVKNNAASKGCTLPTSPTTDEGARPTWSENTNRFEKTDTGLVCKLVIPTDGLVSFNRNHFKKALVEGSGAQQDGARCADGDLTTFCVTSTTGNALGHVEIEFKQPLNVMRVWIANRGDSKVLKLGRFDVLVESEGMNNDRIWVYCVRRQEVNMRSQWNEVICDEAIRGKKVKIMQSARSKADEFHISDVRVQGITDCTANIPRSFGVGAAGTTCPSEALVIKDEAECERAVAMLGHRTGWWKGTLSSMPSGCSINHVNGPHFNRNLSGVGTARADLRPICRVPKPHNPMLGAFWLPTPNHSIKGHNKEQLTGVTVEACKKACIEREWCKSFDYHTKGANKCDLSDKFASEVGGLKNNAGEYDHYSLVRARGRQEDAKIKNGVWGGDCKCPDGSVYQVGDNNSLCTELACVGGKMLTCNRYNGPWSNKQVVCGASKPGKFGWQAQAPGHASCGSRRLYHGRIGLTECKKVCEHDPLCKSIFGGWSQTVPNGGVGSCWTCQEYSLSRVDDMKPELLKDDPNLQNFDFNAWELRRETNWGFAAFINTATCPQGWASLTERECDQVANAIISDGNDRNIAKDNNSPGGCTIPKTAKTGAESKPRWSKGAARADSNRRLVCKWVVPEDGLVSLTSNDYEHAVTSGKGMSTIMDGSRCLDGDITTSCQSPTAENAYIQWSLKRPLMVMRLWIANRGDGKVDALGRFNVRVFDGHAWQTCVYRKEVSRTQQWNEVICDTTLFGVQVKIELADHTNVLNIADVRVQGVHASNTGQGPVYQPSTTYEKIEGHRACIKHTAVKELLCSHEANCVELGAKACNDYGVTCWGYALSDTRISSVTSIELYDYRAVDVYKCSGANGLETDIHWTTYKREHTQLAHYLHMKRPCWNYNYRTGERNIIGTCSAAQRHLAWLIMNDIDRTRKCLLKSGSARLSCFNEEQWKETIGTSMYNIFTYGAAQTPFDFAVRQSKPQVAKTLACKDPKTSRRRVENEDALLAEFLAERKRKDRETVIVSRLSGGRRRRLSTNASSCRKRQALTDAAACSNLKEAADLTVKHFQDQIALTDEKTENLRLQRGLQTVGNGLNMVGSAVSFGLSLSNPLTALAGGAAFYSSVISADSAMRESKQAIQFSEREAELLRKESELEQLRDNSDKVQVCEQPSTDELTCELEELEELVEETFFNIIRVSAKNHLEVMASLASQDKILRRTGITLNSIQNAVKKIEDAVSQEILIKLHLSEARNDVEYVRSRYKDFHSSDRVNEVSAWTAPTSWCTYMDRLGSFKMLLNIVKWDTSDVVFEKTRPSPNRATGEESLLTRCDLDDWRRAYTDVHRSLEVLFSFAASIRQYTQQWRHPSTLSSIASLRLEMANTYTRNMQKIAAVKTAKRCVGDFFECPAHHHRTHGAWKDPNARAQGPEPVNRNPCETNECKCQNGSGAPAGSCFKQESFQCQSCNHGYILNQVTKHCKVVVATCPNGTPKTDLHSSHHEKVNCESCIDSYYLKKAKASDGRSFEECVPNQCGCWAFGREAKGMNGKDFPQQCTSEMNLGGSTSDVPHEKSLCTKDACDSLPKIGTLIGNMRTRWSGDGGQDVFYCSIKNAVIVYSEADYKGEAWSTKLSRGVEVTVDVFWVFVSSIVLYPGFCVSFWEWADESGKYAKYCNCHRNQTNEQRAIGFRKFRDFPDRFGFRRIRKHRCHHFTTVEGEYWVSNDYMKPAEVDLKLKYDVHFAGLSNGRVFNEFG